MWPSLLCTSRSTAPIYTYGMSEPPTQSNMTSCGCRLGRPTLATSCVKVFALYDVSVSGLSAGSIHGLMAGKWLCHDYDYCIRGGGA